MRVAVPLLGLFKTWVVCWAIGKPDLGDEELLASWGSGLGIGTMSWVLCS